MNNSQGFFSFSKLLNEKNSFSICLSANPGIDSVAAGLSLYFALLKLGKNVSISSSYSFKDNGLIGIDKITKTISSGGSNLTISFPYTEGSVNKVTYNIEEDRFNLVIEPKDEANKLDVKDVKYSYSGGSVENIITIDCQNLNSLGALYFENKELFDNKNIINIRRFTSNSIFAKTNIVDKTVTSTSELIAEILSNLNIEIDPDIATNLLHGITKTTNNFSAPNVSAKTFEVAAFLMKNGAQVVRSFNNNKQAFVKPTEASSAFKEKNIENKEIKDEEVNDDFLRPNIFKSGGLL